MMMILEYNFNATIFFYFFFCCFEFYLPKTNTRNTQILDLERALNLYFSILASSFPETKKKLHLLYTFISTTTNNLLPLCVCVCLCLSVRRTVIIIIINE